MNEDIQKFANSMSNKMELRKDRYAVDGWRGLDIKRLIWLLEGELLELKQVSEETDTCNAFEEQLKRQTLDARLFDNCVDIANYAFFISQIKK